VSVTDVINLYHCLHAIITQLKPYNKKLTFNLNLFTLTAANIPEHPVTTSGWKLGQSRTIITTTESLKIDTTDCYLT